MSIASSEQTPTKRRWFGAGFPHIPTPMILLAAAGAVALLIFSRGGGSPEQAAHPQEPHSFLTQVKASIDPLTHWQPRSGKIRITLESTGKANLADANLSVYFRWRTKSNTGEWVRTPNLHVVDLQNAQKLTVAARVPELPSAPSNGFKSWIFGGGNGVGEFLGVVPVADVWITAKANGGANDAPLVDVVETIGVTSMWVGLAAGVGAVLLLAGFLYWFKPEGPRGANLCLQIIETRDGRASLSQFQIILWVFVIGGATAYVMALSGNLVPLTEGTLALLGISGIATLAAQVKTNEAERPAAETEKQRPAAPSWGDLISSAKGEIDVTRLQMLFFTVLIALFVSIHVLDNFQIPEIPTSFLQLMGLSNGVYLVSKFLPNTARSLPPAPDHSRSKRREPSPLLPSPSLAGREGEGLRVRFPQLLREGSIQGCSQFGMWRFAAS